jgi:tetratricopeptide (TPR) repeat protein/NAD-dependent dihydropyrimidine dehydrogenase PreA subunit
MTLIAVHLVMIAHFVQWTARGVTLSPVEPSEGMEFAKHGIINTGLVFFVVAILATAVFGRFFCGWGCHLIALQDLSRWLLIKIGIKPKPLRSRVLGLVPLVAFVYMFLWPAIYKIAVDQPLGPVTTEFLTTDFWATFPGVAVAVLTFAVCGFAIVFVLGSKGYCTYGCPYGAAFGIADRMAPVRIRVTDACRGCATCTSVCTSNVRVHEEVRDHGMVVDPGCMKCLDCVANCPNEALYVGAGRPALGRAGGRSAPGALRWSEEVLVGLAFVLGFVTFRGLYGLVPFLFALGIAAILAGLVLTSWKLLRNRDAWLGPIRLKSDGRIRRSGWVFVIVMVLITASWAHSAVVQELTRRADRLFAQTADLRRTALEIQGSLSPMAEFDRRLVSRARLAAERLDRWSPVVTPDGELIVAWTAFLDGDPAEAKIRVDRALRERPSEVSGHLLAGRLLVEDGRWQEAAGAYSRVVELDPADPAGYLGLGSVLGSSGRYTEALDVFTRGLELNPALLELRYNRGLSLALLGNFDSAAGEFERVLDLDPDFLPARENLAGVLAAAGRFSEAVPVFEEAVRRSPADPQLRIMAARACLEAGLRARAEDHIESAIGLDPSLEPARRLLD